MAFSTDIPINLRVAHSIPASEITANNSTSVTTIRVKCSSYHSRKLLLVTEVFVMAAMPTANMLAIASILVSISFTKYRYTTGSVIAIAKEKMAGPASSHLFCLVFISFLLYNVTMGT